MKLLVANKKNIDRLKIDADLIMAQSFNSMRRWLAEALEFTLGNPSVDKHLPPAIGPQPYRDKPVKVSF